VNGLVQLWFGRDNTVFIEPSDHVSHSVSGKQTLASDIDFARMNLQRIRVGVNRVGVSFRHFARTIGLQPKPQFSLEIIQSILRNPHRYFETTDRTPMKRNIQWDGHGGISLPRVALRMSGRELGWILDLDIRDGVAYFGHFAVVPDLVGKGIAKVMLQVYLANLVEFYGIHQAVFDLRRVNGKIGNYEKFLIDKLARIIHEKCAIKAKPLLSLTTMRMGCLMKFFAMKSLAQVFGGLGRFRAVR